MFDFRLPLFGFANIVQFDVFECCVCGHFPSNWVYFLALSWNEFDQLTKFWRKIKIQLYSIRNAVNRYREVALQTIFGTNKVHQTRVKLSQKHFTSNTLRCELKINNFFIFIFFFISGKTWKQVKNWFSALTCNWINGVFRAFPNCHLTDNVIIDFDSTRANFCIQNFVHNARNVKSTNGQMPVKSPR